MRFELLATVRGTWLVLVALPLVSGFAADYSESESARSPQALVQELLDDVKKGGTGSVIPFKECGDPVIPAIVEALHGASWRGQEALLRALRAISGEKATRALMDIALHSSDPRLRYSARMMSQQRQIDIPLSEAEVEILRGDVASKDVFNACREASILSNCRRLSADTRARPIIKRFVSQIVDPEDVTTHRGTRFPPEISVLYVFALAFSNIGVDSVPLLVAAQAETANAEVKKWLTLARGFAGDKEVEDQVLAIMRSDENKYVRCVAISAYAYCAGEEAIPVLETFLDDKTLNDHGGIDIFPPPFLFAYEAWSQLQRLNKELGLSLEMGPAPRPK